MTDGVPFPAPFAEHEATIRAEWVDYNGHMNLAYYVLVFDHATDRLLDAIDLGEAYRRRAEASLFVVESHVVYAREVHEGQRVRITSLVAGADAKRLHLFHEMHHADDGFLAATNELMMVHVDMAARASSPMPADAAARAATAAAAHAGLPRPRQLGRAISMPVARPGAAPEPLRA